MKSLRTLYGPIFISTCVSLTHYPIVICSQALFFVLVKFFFLETLRIPDPEENGAFSSLKLSELIRTECENGRFPKISRHPHVAR